MIIPDEPELKSPERPSDPSRVSRSSTERIVLIAGEPRPLIPDGEYQAWFDHHEFASAYGHPRVYLHFGIAAMADDSPLPSDVPVGTTLHLPATLPDGS